MQKGLGSLPPGVAQAALGGTHTPVNPHRQRLLVAANKAVELKHTTSGNSKAKTKPKPTTTMKDAAAEEAEIPKTNDAPLDAKTLQPKKRAPYPDTAYNIARKKFMATLLDLILIAE